MDAAAGAGPAADGAPGSAAADGEGVLLPFSGPTNLTWEEAAVAEARDKTNRKVFRILNGQRATVWRICVEKKRKQLAAIFGGLVSDLPEFPPDCRRKVLEFLPASHSSGLAGVQLHATECKRMTGRRRAEIVAQWVEVISKGLQDGAKKNGWERMLFPKTFINEQNCPGTLNSTVPTGIWWKDASFQAKLRSLGYIVSEIKEGDAGYENPNDANSPFVISIGPS